jgi:tRNA threonylcarbamoyladenosine modification (KEOPS) complex Cgi121 subunit
LRIEQLGVDGKDKVVGIAELRNSNNLKQKELIQLATSMSSDSLTVQLLNALLIANEIHLLSAAQNAIQAQQGDYMTSRSLDVEIIVFASAQRQIGRALEALGVHDGLAEIALVVIGTDPSSVERSIKDLADTIGTEILPSFTATSERIKRVKQHFQISDREISALSESETLESQLDALSRCIVSRVSLVAFDT